MSFFKCKMCGGDLEIAKGVTIAKCEYCNTKQTIPKLDNEKRANMYDRANHFRRNNEFDIAMGIYEQILSEDTTDAEAYWSIVLCRYGIEYVEDPSSHRRIPTIHRMQYTSILNDEDYKSAIENADILQRTIYEAEATAIDEIQKQILIISQKEKPFDVFICYKETDANGQRTIDSVLAQDLYYQLTKENIRVFFSRITLEDKLGTAYEPYIFAALNSAKVMIVLGTKAEHFNAVWVKNEWSRYLSIAAQSNGEKVLIPAYKDMSPYDLPSEFSNLQGQDMSKIGFLQDLIHGIKKIVKVEEIKTATTANANVDSLLKRAFMFLDDGNWKSANEYCERVLDTDPENAQAYLGKLMSELHAHNKEQLKNCRSPFDSNANYNKVLRFADEKLKAEMRSTIEHIKTRIKNAKLEVAYNDLIEEMKDATTEEDYKYVADGFEKMGNYKDAQALSQECLKKAESIRIKKESKAEIARVEAQRRKKRKTWTTCIGLSLLILTGLIAYFIIYPAYSYAKGNYAPYINIYNVERFEIPNGTNEIRGFALAGCHSLKSVSIPDSVTTIGTGAFRGSTSLKSITIPNSVTSIGINAFMDCTSLESVSIPDSVTGIGMLAFSGCTSLTSITIGNSVTYFGGSEFSDCSSVTNLTLKCNVPDEFCESMPNLTTVVLEDGVTSIGEKTFADCVLLTSITLPDSVTTIDACAFMNCTSLESVSIPDSVTSIGNAAFSGCTSLTSVTIPNYVTSIGSSAFEGCTSLTSIIIPNSVTAIDNNVFSGCTSLTSIAIPNSVISIDFDAFSNCTSLTSVTIPNSVTSIGSSAFGGCISLESIAIPNSVTSIGIQAFMDCTSLISVKIPDSVTSMGDSAFKGCTSLTYNEYDNAKYLGNENNPYIYLADAINNDIAGCNIHVNTKFIGARAFEGCSLLKNITIPDLVTSIDNRAFADCGLLKSINIPDSMTRIGYRAFSGCISLKSITIPDSVTVISGLAFSGCTSLTIYCEAKSMPANWWDQWNFSDCPVVWGSK